MLQWLTLYTKPKMERQAEGALVARRIEAFLPVVYEYSAHYRRKVAAPFFPCYLFARLEPTSPAFRALGWMPGLKSVVRFEGQVAWVPDDVIACIAKRIAHWDEEVTRREDNRFQPGDRVRVTSGPFADVEAIFDRKLSKEGRVRILVDVLGRLKACSIDANVVERLG